MANSILQAFAIEHQKHLQIQQQLEDDSEFGGQQRKRKTSCRTGVALSTEQKMRLIDYIHERPQIWDCTIDGFRSNQSRQSAFNEVATLLSDANETFSRIQIQEEWGKLRYCFTRIMKKLLEEGGGQVDEAQMIAISWPYWKRMEFLLSGVRAQLHQTASTESESGAQEQGSPGKESNASTTITSKARRKRSVRKNSIVTDAQEPPQNNATVQSTTSPQQLSTQDFLMANFAALNSSQNLLGQFQQQQKILQNCRAPSTIQRQKSMDGDFEREKNYEVRPLLSGVVSMSTAELVTALGAIKAQSNGTGKVNSDTDNYKRDNEFTAYSPPRLSNSILSTSMIEQQQPSASGDLTNGWRHPSEARRDSSEPDGESGSEIAESFGRCIVQQLQTVARKSPMLGVQMRRELMDVCFKYEMQACVIESGHS
uniref:MADF domain-containing protein n=1 Tax=Globodera pallida TaxID=36090 RepID=A0A183C5L0_GLOPA